MRKYKENNPINTIIKIRQLLSEINVVNYESDWTNIYKNVYSVRVNSFESEGNFAQTGKGLTKEYSLASGYAEYIERLQNNFLTGATGLNRTLLTKIKKETGYYYYPDEKIINKNEFKQLPKSILTDFFDKEYLETDIDFYFDRLKANGLEGVVSVPFFDISNNRTIYLPFNLLMMVVGSNGMAAGNTLEEASFQGISELLERYASSIIYYDQLTPPTVPVDYLKTFETQYNIIKDIQSQGYEVIIKDLSVEKKLPVLGAIVINRETKRYRFNVGADTFFHVALSRVLTEIHQGIKSKKLFDSLLLEIPTKEYEYFKKNDELSLKKRYKEFKHFCINNSGSFPISLFSNKESYVFNPKAFSPKNSFLDEVIYYNSLINSLGKNLYIRNVSFLGFPSIFAYIPKTSVLGSKIENRKSIVKKNVDLDFIEDLMFPFNTFVRDKQKIKNLINIIEIEKYELLNSYTIAELLKIEFKANSVWHHLPLTFLLTLLHYLIGDFKNAIKYLKTFMKSIDKTENDYYKQVLLYFSLLNNKKQYSIIKKEISSDVLLDFTDIDALFSNVGMPNCPNCKSCNLFNDCITKNKIDYYIRLMNKFKINKNNVNQNFFNKYKTKS